MRALVDKIALSATDLANFLGCRHRSGLDALVALGQLAKPRWADPFADALRLRGQAHERRFVGFLRTQGLDVLDLTDRSDAGHATLEAMRKGMAVIVQAQLDDGDWRGYVDVLRRVETPSALGSWSYEVWDTKLARETRAGTVLQLAVYSELLAITQGAHPEHFHVVTPDPAAEPTFESGVPGLAPVEALRAPLQVHSYRLSDYASYYRLVRTQLQASIAGGPEVMLSAYPEPVEHCGVCRWLERCEARRRQDDHLSYIAGASRVHRTELVANGYDTLQRAAGMALPIPFTPLRGSKESYEKLREQARLQAEQRAAGAPRFELLPVRRPAPDVGEAPSGLCRLPAPSPRDLFLDLEGARFAREGGREYLFGLWMYGQGGTDVSPSFATDGTHMRPRSIRDRSAPDVPPFTYLSWWAYDDAQEKAAFEAVIDLIMRTWAAEPRMHVYHFGHYEPTTFKRLAGRHATRAEEMDQLLRAERFVDLFTVTRQAVRAGVESYSIKQLEQFYGFTRDVSLRHANTQLHAIELALEADAPTLIEEAVRDAVEGYNCDDCRSTMGLRDWLETLRSDVEKSGTLMPRPDRKDGEPSEKVGGLQKEAEGIRERLLADLAPEARDRMHPDHPRWLLAFLVDWHRRESKAEWWEFFRLKDLPEDELLDERQAIAGLEFAERVDAVLNKRTNRPTGSVIDRYRYPSQEMEISGKARLQLQDGGSFGDVVALDREARVIDVRKGPARSHVHPKAVFAADIVSSDVVQRAVMRLGQRVAGGGGGDEARSDLDLLFRRAPRLALGQFTPNPGELPVDFAVRIVTNLDHTTLAIQGPPGAGKTYAGARMIRALVQAGQRVGVTAVSHKVIVNLLEDVRRQAQNAGEAICIGRKVSEVDDAASPLKQIEGNEDALAAIQRRQVQVLGGTAWLWAREEFAGAVDVLFVDEAGQMSLANVLAVSQAAKSVVLLGDPQQLEQPQKGSHPEGVSLSALEYVIGEAKTMPAEQGIFMPETWRLAPAVCAFTSEMFYERQLRSKAGLEHQRLVGTGTLDGAGLWWVPVEHDRNRSSSIEEVDEIAVLVDRLLGSGSRCVDEHGIERQLVGSDLRVIAPYNAQVNRLSERLANRGVPVGTVDRFQGQTAAVVIYSMATSRPEDAPRGMEFLYSLNRLNVATSRARCAAILVASPRLFEPVCRTPRQMQLANALCRFREMATVLPQ